MVMQSFSSSGYYLVFSGVDLVISVLGFLLIVCARVVEHFVVGFPLICLNMSKYVCARMCLHAVYMSTFVLFPAGYSKKINSQEELCLDLP